MDETEIQDVEITLSGQTLTGLAGKIKIGDDASIMIDLDPLVYRGDEARKTALEHHLLFENIFLSNARRVPKFEIRATALDGTKINTSHARLSKAPSYNFAQDPVELKPIVEADEIYFEYPEAIRLPEKVVARVLYLTRGQLGGVHPDEVDLQVGTLAFAATCDMGAARKSYGSLYVEAKKRRDQLDDWVEECDEVAERALHLLSLAQGRWFNWSARIVYVRHEDENWHMVSRCVRPREQRHSGRIHAFHNLNLEPILALLKENYTRELIDETGLDMALTLMLTSSAYTESRIWFQLVALDHLLSYFEPKWDTIIKREKFDDEVKPKLLSALQLAMSDLGYDEESDAFKTFRGKISGVNAPTYYSKFRQFVEYYGVPLDDLDSEDVKSVVLHCRNDLAHLGVLRRVGQDRAERHYLGDLAEEILNRIVMAMVRYEGQYVSSFYRLEGYHFSTAGVRPLNPTLQK